MRGQSPTPGGDFIAVAGTKDRLSIIAVSLQIGEEITEQRSLCITTRGMRQPLGVGMTPGENTA